MQAGLQRLSFDYRTGMDGNLKTICFQRALHKHSSQHQEGQVDRL